MKTAHTQSSRGEYPRRRQWVRLACWTLGLHLWEAVLLDLCHRDQVKVLAVRRRVGSRCGGEAGTRDMEWGVSCGRCPVTLLCQLRDLLGAGLTALTTCLDFPSFSTLNPGGYFHIGGKLARNTPFGVGGEPGPFPQTHTALEEIKQELHV